MSMNSQGERNILTSSLRTAIILGVISAISLGGYLLFAHFTLRSGFPLDDAWIHQTYARNLARSGEWAFVPGQPSAGSTAPLWSAALAVGHAVGLGPYVWTYVLGWVTLWGVAVAGFYGFRMLSDSRPEWALWVGVFMALEWHLVWAAGSGMETLLFALLILVVLIWLVRLERIEEVEGIGGTSLRLGDRGSGGERETGGWGDGESGREGERGSGRVGGGLDRWWFHFDRAQYRRQAPAADVSQPPDVKGWFWLGVLIGVSVWLRPDGVTLLGPVGLGVLAGGGSWRQRVRVGMSVLAGFAVVAGPYLVFNRALAGAWWPNTFYAKQAEYAVHREFPFWLRYWGEFALPLVGAGAVLLPGFAYALYDHARRRAWAVVGLFLWALGYLGLYAWRLPVTYQHGRYVMPAMPVFFLLGLVGTIGLMDLNAAAAWKRVLSRTWVITLGAVLVVFWMLGGRAYGRDVAVIESEMVETAQWVAENTDSGALVAAHDIGALGYFGERELVDLAGLVSPEVIAFIRDEGALADYLDAEGADYLVTFPGWYPQLVREGELVYQTGGRFSPVLGGENMAVYRWGGD